MTSFSTSFGAAILFTLAASPLAADVDFEAGRSIFNETAVPSCAICHTLQDAGAEGEVGPDLDELAPTFEQVRAAVTSGIGVMPSFAETLTEEEIETVSRYVAQVVGKDAASAAPAGEATEQAAAETEETVADGVLAMGDATAGEKAFRKCQACHTVDEGGANRVGPNLYGIVGSPVASVAGYDYSSAMEEHGGTWTPDRLAEFLEAPRKVVPKTKMAFPGLRKPQEQADVIAYLASLASE